MLTIPYEIAKWITLDKMHPVTAWRRYCHMTKQSLSTVAGISMIDIEQIEKSNLHLKENFLKKLCGAFGIYPETLNIRHLTI